MTSYDLLSEEEGWEDSLEPDLPRDHFRPYPPIMASFPKNCRAIQDRIWRILEGLSNSQGRRPRWLSPDFLSRVCLHPWVPLGIQRASGKPRELPKHLVPLIILLINVYRCQQHGNCCLGTGVETHSGEFSGWMMAT